jgi:hypothetical protein
MAQQSPKAAFISGVATVIGAIITVVGGFWFQQYWGSRNAASQSDQQAVKITVSDKLEYSQVEKQVRVLIDGKVVGTLLLDKKNERDSLTVNLPGKGSYGYRIEAHGVFENARGYGTHEHVCRDQGTLVVNGEKEFSFMSQHGDNEWSLKLQN